MGKESVGMGVPPTTISVSALLSGFESGVEVATVAVLPRLPEAAGDTRTVIVTVAPPPAGTVPRFAVTMPVDPTGGPPQVPWLVWQETNVAADGSGSVIETASASAGPAFPTVSV